MVEFDTAQSKSAWSGELYNCNTAILQFMNSKKSETLYRWPEWVCLELKPFAFVESEYTQKYPKLGNISVNTLEKYVHLVSNGVEREITPELSEKFAIIFDGWTEACVHFIGIMASFPSAGNNRYKISLLAF